MKKEGESAYAMQLSWKWQLNLEMSQRLIDYHSKNKYRLHPLMRFD